MLGDRLPMQRVIPLMCGFLAILWMFLPAVSSTATKIGFQTGYC